LRTDVIIIFGGIVDEAEAGVVIYFLTACEVVLMVVCGLFGSRDSSEDSSQSFFSFRVRMITTSSSMVSIRTNHRSRFWITSF
jgi:hypothetical protein